MRTVLRSLLLVLVSTGLTGCGGSSEPAVPADRKIVTSAADCSADEKLTIEVCGSIIEAAISQHVAAAPTYTSLKSCEKTEGPGKCERSDAKSYRPALAAYLVTHSEPPVAAPLYPTSDGSAGFQMLDKTKFLDEDDKLPFSKSSVAMYERFMGVGNGDSGYNF